MTYSVFLRIKQATCSVFNPAMDSPERIYPLLFHKVFEEGV